MGNGFSLVELSIVLVILGLLTGGILSGQSLIRAAEMRGIATQTDMLRTSFYTFRDKYRALPGDMPNAVKFWGAQAGGTADGYNATCAALLTAATGTATCNGDGDGDIARNSTEHYESYRAWQHLANAGLVEGSYTGVTAATDATEFLSVPGQNVVAGKISNSGFTVRSYAAALPANTLYFVGEYGNIFWAGLANGTTNPYTSAAAFLPEEMWNIDVKMDDGKPAYGKIRSTKSYSNCHTNIDPTISQYALSFTSRACAMLISVGL